MRELARRSGFPMCGTQCGLDGRPRVPLCVRQELMKERYAPELAWIIHHVVLRQYTSWVGTFRRKRTQQRTSVCLSPS